MIRKPVEHYVVKPNQTQGDWTYEYSNGSKVSDCDCCKMDTKRLSISIDNLRTSLQALQLSMQNMSMNGGMSQEQLNQAIEEVVNQYMQDSTTLQTIVSQAVSSDPDITNIKQQFRSLNIQELTNLGTQFSSLDTRFTGLSNLVSTLNGDVTTVKGNVTTLSGNLSRHIGNTEIHVTAADKARWDANTAPVGGTSVRYNEQTKTLEITV